jgi:hypothetical protein
LSKRTVEYIHTVLHSALKQAVRWNLVLRNVTEAVDLQSPLFAYPGDTQLLELASA